MSGDRPVLRLEGARKAWVAKGRRLDVVAGVDLDIFPGRSVAVTGPSGSGKSTLLHLLAMLTPLDAGRLLFHERQVSRRWRAGLRFRRSIGIVFQDGKLVPGLNLVQNVGLPLAHRGVWGRKRRDLARRVLDHVGLLDHADYLPRQLSGGELTRVAIARALVFEPEVLLCDEPTGSLDDDTADRISHHLFETVRRNTALVLVTHSARLANRADEVFSLEGGKLTRTGGAS